MAKANGLPLRHHFCGALSYRLQKIGVRVAFKLGCGPALRVKTVNDVIGQDSELGVLTTVRKMLKVTKPDKARSNPGDNGCSLGGFAAYGRVGTRDAQSARGRNTQAVHGLTA